MKIIKGIRSLCTGLLSMSLLVPSLAPAALQAAQLPELKVMAQGEGVVKVSYGETAVCAEADKPYEASLQPGTPILLEAKADKDAWFSALLVNGQSVVQDMEEETYTYSLEMPDAPLEIQAVFVRAENRKQESGKAVSIDYERSTWSEKETQILADYAAGNAAAHKEWRLEKAAAMGLEGYIDSEGFLVSGFYDDLGSAVLMYDGLLTLSRLALPGVQEAALERLETQAASLLSAQSENLTVTGKTSFNFNPPWGYSISNGLWQMSNGRFAFCANGTFAEPMVGKEFTAPAVQDNANLRKALYYGWDGPEDQLTATYGKAGAIVITNDLVSYAHVSTSVSIAAANGYHWKNGIKAIAEKIFAMPDPASKGFEAFIMNTTGSGTSWNGTVQPLQPLTYGAMVPKGSLQIQKVSSNPDMSNGNDNYNLTSGIYGLFQDAKCTKKVAELKIAANGWSNTVENLDYGTYYLKEIKAPEGYDLDPTVKTVEVSAARAAREKVSDNPQSNPIDIVLKKVDSETLTGTPQGAGSLKDAQFTVKFYGGKYEEGQDPGKDNIQPDAQWVLKSDEKGLVKLSDAYKVSGDAFYTNSKGEAVFPLGTVTIQETKAPQGYHINDTIFVQRITASGNQESVSTWQAPVIADDVISMRVEKVEEKSRQPLEGVAFVHTDPTGTKQTVRTDADGRVVFKGLLPGVHTLEESEPLEGFVPLQEVMEFTVHANGTISAKNLPELVELKNGVLTVANRLQPSSIRIEKTNEDGKKLDGAEFTFYADEKCTQEIFKAETVNGILEFPELEAEQTVWFQETRAPQGYRLPFFNKVYDVTLHYDASTGSFSLTSGQETIDSASEAGDIVIVQEAGKCVVTFTILNHTSLHLPDTGSAATLKLLAAGVLCTLAGLAWMHRSSRKEP